VQNAVPDASSCDRRSPQASCDRVPTARGASPCAINDVRWIDLPSYHDARGVLTAIEGEVDIPFAIERVFYMHHVAADRGGHAHTDTDQVIIASSGSLQVGLSDGATRATYRLDDATKGLYVPRMIFVELYGFSEGAVCLVLANTRYDMSKSIRSWQEYLKAIADT
jgi:hypothetical protein